MTNSTHFSPTSSQSRQHSIDLLRGLALLGILLVNMETWALPSALRYNPLALGTASNSDIIVWAFIRSFAEYKFIGLFSLLFGAGIAMQTERAQAKNIEFKRFYFRRLFWLGCLGFIHSMIWNYEILFMYSLWGSLIFYFVYKPINIQKRLMWTFLLLSFFFSLLMIVLFQVFPEDMSNKFWLISSDKLSQKITYVLSPLSHQWLDRLLDFVAKHSIFLILTEDSWKIGGMMIAGILLYKKGVISAEKSLLWYQQVAIITFSIGSLLVIPGLYFAYHYQWHFAPYASIQKIWLPLSSFCFIFTYLAITMIWFKKGYFASLQKKLQSVGRMALSNYLLHTIIGTFIFYGYGLGLFNQLSRVELILLTFSVWTAQLIVSDIWLKHFHFGPFEWLWRSLSYRQRQPFSR